MTPHSLLRRPLKYALQCLAATLMAVGATAHAALIGAVPGAPDIQSTYMALTYDATTSTLSIDDTASTQHTLFKDGSSSTLTADDYRFSATVDSAGNFSGGSLQILDGASTLLDATVDAFGWEFGAMPGFPTTGKFDAIFTVNQADPILGLGSTGAMQASFDLEFPGVDPASPWTASFASQSDMGLINTGAYVYSVPAPSTLSLLLAAALGAGYGRRRRRIRVNASSSARPAPLSN